MLTRAPRFTLGDVQSELVELLEALVASLILGALLAGAAVYVRMTRGRPGEKHR